MAIPVKKTEKVKHKTEKMSHKIVCKGSEAKRVEKMEKYYYTD